LAVTKKRKKKKEKTSVGEDVEKREPLCTLMVGMKIGVAAMENIMDLPQKIKNRSTMQSSNSTSRLSKEKKH